MTRQNGRQSLIVINYTSVFPAMTEKHRAHREICPVHLTLPNSWVQLRLTPDMSFVVLYNAQKTAGENSTQKKLWFELLQRNANQKDTC